MKGKILVKNLKELSALTESFSKEILSSKTINLVLFIEAEMGAGKTTFTSYLGKALGIESRITSPTFVGMHHYESDRVDLYHYDCYQVKPSFADTLEILDSDKKKVLVLEWAGNLDKSFVKAVKKNAEILLLKIEVLEDEVRQFIVS